MSTEKRRVLCVQLLPGNYDPKAREVRVGDGPWMTNAQAWAHQAFKLFEACGATFVLQHELPHSPEELDEVDLLLIDRQDDQTPAEILGKVFAACGPLRVAICSGRRNDFAGMSQAYRGGVCWYGNRPYTNEAAEELLTDSFKAKPPDSMEIERRYAKTS